MTSEAAAKGFWDGVARSYIPDAQLHVDPSLKFYRSREVDVDPITFEVIRYALLNVNFEHCRLIQRLAVSPVVMVARDSQSSVLFEDGDLLCLGPNVQYFSNSQSLTVKWILEKRSASPGIRPGDMFLCNDPYIGSPHQQDACLALPIFVGDELFCWIANTLHYSDVGGSSPGSFCIAARDAWDDPPAFPAIRLVEQGVIRRDVEEVFVRQSRIRKSVLMDLRAAVTSNEATARRIIELIDRYGADPIKSVMRRMMDASEKLFAERLNHIPDGRWSARGYVESSVPSDNGIYRYQVNIKKRGGELLVDNEGTDPQAGAINITFVAFAGTVLTALVQSIVPDLAGCYGGAYRRVIFAPRSGLLNCADFPAAVSTSGSFTSEMMVHLATHAVGRMLACGDQDASQRILGVPQPAFYSGIYTGLDETGSPFVAPSSDNMIGGSGGAPTRDGADAAGHYWMPGAIAENVEQAESYYPMLYLYRRFMPGGHDGAGQHRGGLGMVVGAVPRGARHFEFALAGNEAFTRANGLLGGNPGARGWTRVVNESSVQKVLAEGTIPQSLDVLRGKEIEVPPKACGIVVDSLGVFEWSGTSTAGCGDPFLRDPQSCLSDVEAGLFDGSAVAQVYGVVLRAPGGESGHHTVDIAATRELRRSMLEARLGKLLRSEAALDKGLTATTSSLLRVSMGQWQCGCCEAAFGPAHDNYKSHAEFRVQPIDMFAPGFESPRADLAKRMEFRAFLCPNCGVRFDTEIARREDEILHDMSVEGAEIDISPIRNVVAA